MVGQLLIPRATDVPYQWLISQPFHASLNCILVMRRICPHILVAMDGVAHFTLETDDYGASRLVLSGPLLVSTIGPFERELDRISEDIARIDLADVGEIDTVGAWVVS